MSADKAKGIEDQAEPATAEAAAAFAEDPDGQLGLNDAEYLKIMQDLDTINSQFSAIRYADDVDEDMSERKYFPATIDISKSRIRINFEFKIDNKTYNLHFDKSYDFDCRYYACYIPLGLYIPGQKIVNFSDFPFEIARKEGDDYRSLPETPPLMWPGARALNLPHRQAVLLFLRAVYRPYIESGLGSELSSYFHLKDPKLYRAIQEYKRGGRSLPVDLPIPSEREKLGNIRKQADEKGLDTLDRRQLLSLARKLAREGREP